MKNEKKNLEGLAKNSKIGYNLSKTSTSNLASNSTSSTVNTSVMVNSATLTCSPSSSALSSPNSTSASSFSSPNNLASNVTASATPFPFNTRSLTSSIKNCSAEKTHFNLLPENATFVVTAVLEALMNPASAPAALTMISSDRNIQNLLADYFATCNSANAFDFNSTSPNFNTDLSMPSVTEDMLKTALQKALKSAQGNENTGK